MTPTPTIPSAAPGRPARRVAAAMPRGLVWFSAIALVIGGSVVPAVAGAADTPSAVAGYTADADSASSPGSAHGWRWPVAGPRAILRPFDPPAHEYGAGHRGMDVGAAPGAAVTSPASGVVTFAGPVAGRSVVTIDHGGGVVSSFDPVVPAVPPGSVVSPGTTIGRLESGEAMHCDEGCLHLGVRVQGSYVDPVPYFAPPERSVLLPLGA